MNRANVTQIVNGSQHLRWTIQYSLLRARMITTNLKSLTQDHAMWKSVRQQLVYRDPKVVRVSPVSNDTDDTRPFGPRHPFVSVSVSAALDFLHLTSIFLLVSSTTFHLFPWCYPALLPFSKSLWEGCLTASSPFVYPLSLCDHLRHHRPLPPPPFISGAPPRPGRDSASVSTHRNWTL